MTKGDKKIRIFSALEVANICGVVNQTAINWIKNGHLKAFMTPGGQYRIYSEDLLSFLDSRGMKMPDKIETISKYSVDWSSVLIVDDDNELNTLVKKVLEKRFSDLTVYQAFDGFEAGRILSEKRPGFVILDIELPGVNGFKLCSKIKEDPIFGKPFIIAITGYDTQGTSETILKEGADAFFGKPFNMDELCNSLATFSERVKG